MPLLPSADGKSQMDRKMDSSVHKKQITVCLCLCVCVCVCVCRSLQEEVQQPMEPIAEERIEMPEAQTNADSRDMLRCSKHKLANTHKHTHTDTQTYFVTPRNAWKTFAAVSNSVSLMPTVWNESYIVDQTYRCYWRACLYNLVHVNPELYVVIMAPTPPTPNNLLISLSVTVACSTNLIKQHQSLCKSKVGTKCLFVSLNMLVAVWEI